ncbi:MAG TPA: glycosyltransferase family A protein [Steroidobacteraceae bacterium]|jgi:glycosyltransferase involved in cell wall biosynthesis|nr:glycosyltransferase family A protein [Steroidobacteraceae bacterium]
MERSDATASRSQVTIGIPVYNGERFLRQALDGLLAQSFTDFVVVISDNASTDGTRAICEEYAGRDARISYVAHAANRGAVWNFNQVAELAASPLFMWHAADDVAAPRYLESCVAGLAASPSAVLAYTVAGIIDEDGQPMPHESRPLDLASPLVAQRFTACLSPFHYSENVFYGVVRTDCLKRTQLHGDFAGGDRALSAELSLYGPFVRIDEPLFSRRQTRPQTQAQVAFYNTGRQEVSLREWQILRQNLRSVRRSPVPLSSRPALYGALLRRCARHAPLYVNELKQLLKAALGRGD